MDPREPIVTAYTSQEYSRCLSLLEASPSEIASLTDMRILQASCLINLNGRTGEAHQILDKILESEPENGLAFYGKGLAFLRESNLEKSFENFNKAAELDTTGVISKAQIMKLKTEEMLKSKRKSNRLSGKQSKENSAAITCEVCNKTFAQLFSLNRHKLIHSGERPHKCTICTSGFVQKSDLQRHMSVHNEIANFPCESCEKKFKSKKNLSLHMMTHSVERPFKCETCGKDFKYRRLMKLHQIIHSKRKKYNCDFCEKIFVTKPSLKAHVMMHINRMNKEGVRLSDGIVVQFDNKLSDQNMEIFEEGSGNLNLEVGKNQEKLDTTSNEQENNDLVSKNETKPAKTRKYTKKKQESSENSNENKKELKKSKKKSAKNTEKSESLENIAQIQTTLSKNPQNQKDQENQIKNPENIQISVQPSEPVQPNSHQVSTNSPQTVRNSARIQNRNSLGTKRNLIKTNPNSSKIRRESLGFDKNTAKIQQKLEKVKQNLSKMQVSQYNSVISTNVPLTSDNTLKNSQSSPMQENASKSPISGVNVPELLPQISIISNNSQKSTESHLGAPRFSLGNIELPPSLQIRPILGLEGSRIRNARNSISGMKIATNSTIGLNSRLKNSSENVAQSTSNLIPPTRFITPNSVTLNPLTAFMSTPQSTAIVDPRISSIFSNPQISVAVTSTSSSATNAKPANVSNTASKWSVASNPTASEFPKQDSSNEENGRMSNQEIKQEPMEIQNCDQNNRMEAETSSNHDSLFSSENEHQNEWNLFFKSLMHDLTKMDERQRRKFKQKTFMLIDDILQ